MTWEITLLFLLILAMIVVMALEKFTPDTVAVGVMVILILGGFVTPAQGISGLSNQATVTILALMILSVGLEVTGVIAALGRRLKKVLVGGEWKTVLIVMVIAGTCSAFISTTAIVVMFMRILIKISERGNLNLSRLLMPLSFAAILGGSCTLMGTSTNLLVDAIAVDAGLPGFSVFEFSKIGMVFFGAGIIYLTIVGRHLIPRRKDESEDLTAEYDIQPYLTEAIVQENSNLIGKPLSKTPFFRDEEIDLIEVRSRQGSSFPAESKIVRAGDILLIKASVDKLAELRQANDVSILTGQGRLDEDRMNTKEMTICEVIIKPSSRLVGKAINKIDIRRDYDAIPLAVKKQRKYYSSDLEEIKIDPGDTLLMEVGRRNFKRFYNRPEFVVLQEYEDLAARTDRKSVAAIIVVIVIMLAALEVLPLLTSALAGCVAMFLTGVLDLQRAYRRVEWNVYFLLAGVIPLGIAMDNTGASHLIADSFTAWFGNVSAHTLVAMLYLITTLLSAVISNNATAILFAPIAISIASNLGLDPRPLLLTIMFAANMSFISPIGYQTNTLVYSAGQYRFGDFFKVGGLLSLIIWLLSIWLIPEIYF